MTYRALHLVPKGTCTEFLSTNILIIDSYCNNNYYITIGVQLYWPLSYFSPVCTENIFRSLLEEINILRASTELMSQCGRNAG